MKQNTKNILFWIFVSFVIFLILLALAIIISWDIIYLYFTSEYNQSITNFCNGLTGITYSQPLVVPTTNGVYQKNVANALLEISLAVSDSNCNNILPIPNPPTFSNQLRVEGINPVNSVTNMFAYIFWNDTEAVIAFTGTFFISEWVSDFRYKQIAPTQLKGYTGGVLVHSGFYAIYLTIRDQLWNWWTEHEFLINNLFITGHSLGSALSTICAYDFANVSPLIHYGFAGPRVGNIIFADVFKQRIPTSLRINNTEDLITALPPSAWYGNIYQHTQGSIPFTVSLNSLLEDHVNAYQTYLPVCPEVEFCS